MEVRKDTLQRMLADSTVAMEVDARSIDGAKMIVVIHSQKDLSKYEYDLKIAMMKIIRGMTIEHIYEHPDEVLKAANSMLPKVAIYIDYITYKFERRIQDLFDRLEEARVQKQIALVEAEQQVARVKAERRILEMRYAMEMETKKRQLEMQRVEEIEHAKIRKEVKKIEDGKNN